MFRNIYERHSNDLWLVNHFDYYYYYLNLNQSKQMNNFVAYQQQQQKQQQWQQWQQSLRQISFNLFVFMKFFMNLAKYNIINIINTCEQKQTAAGLCARELFSYIQIFLFEKLPCSSWPGDMFNKECHKRNRSGLLNKFRRTRNAVIFSKIYHSFPRGKIVFLWGADNFREMFQMVNCRGAETSMFAEAFHMKHRC